MRTLATRGPAPILVATCGRDWRQPAMGSHGRPHLAATTQSLFATCSCRTRSASAHLARRRAVPIVRTPQNTSAKVDVRVENFKMKTSSRYSTDAVRFTAANNSKSTLKVKQLSTDQAYYGIFAIGLDR